MTPTLEVEVELVVVDEDLQEELMATTIDELGDSLVKSHVVPTSYDTTTFSLFSSNNKKVLFKGLKITKHHAKR